MTPIEFLALTLIASGGAGFLGSLLGLGGGIIIVPFLTLVMGVDIHYAIGASIVSVIATSSGAAAAYLRDHITNIRIGMFLEIATTTGAMTGALLAGVLGGPLLFLLFAVLLGYSALSMLRRPTRTAGTSAVPHDRIADSLGLSGSYYDAALGRTVGYRASGGLVGLFLMYIAGAVSGLLGIGSGVLKVPAMDIAMYLPMKVSTATSNFMIGVTAAASAGVYFSRGQMNPFIAAPVALGVLFGATLGTRVMAKTKSTSLRRIFVVVLLVVATEMLIRGLSMMGV
jgi:uncharacterized membrane protein YfcA